MALIQCKECGKRISDTTEVCVHCGAPTNMSANETSSEMKVDMESSRTELSDDEEKVVVFQNLNFDRQCELEKEFWSVDHAAEKHKKRGGAKISTGLLTLGYIILLVFSLFPGLMIILEQGDWFKNWDIYNLFYSDGHPWLPYFLLFTFFVWMLICTFRSTYKKEAKYKKQFQLWLKVEKNIDYIPQFNSERERNIWNRTSVNR